MKLAIFLLITIPLFYSQALCASWLKIANHPSNAYNKITTSVLDQSDNLIFAGLSETSFEIDTFELNGNATNGFIGKINALGDISWLVPLVTDTLSDMSVSIRGISTDDTGNIYVTGVFKVSATIGEVVLISEPDDMSTNGFILKFNSNGKLIWHKIFTNVDSCSGETIVWSANKLYVGVRFNISFNFNNTEIRSVHPNAHSNNNSALVCLSDSGNMEWVSIVNAEASLIRSISADSDNVYVLCHAKGQPFLTDNINSTIFPLNHAIGLYDVYLIGLNKHNGTAKWGNLIGGENYETAAVICCYNNAIYCTGQFKSELKCKSQDGNMQKLTASAGNKNIAFITRYDTGGNLIWAKKFGDYTNTSILDLNASSAGVVASILFTDSIHIASKTFYAKAESKESILTIIEHASGDVSQLYNTVTQNTNEHLARTYFTGIKPIAENRFIYCGYTKGKFSFEEATGSDENSEYYTSIIGLLEPSLNVKPVEVQHSLNIYPNPTTGIIHFKNLPATTNTIHVYTLLGNKIASKKLSSKSADLSFLSSGYYIINCSTQYYKLFVK